ncbi:fructose-1,6-bisphosphate aldolase/phosphatase [Nocardioides sp. QY071]|uniref:fructose-1,6-bisphosphate aldolase/phosphatase n=1 Tax=Nocardioides sp. QY071 TaxID=3044187 RepID=UPI00249C0558|nr:fructose-1,6-bisphosphate aldolase/phosphatase [Nocardioides sp. QY071]WGY04543.1 fructose-1,6-bisphosphate aldolase/phosphatase [Nocardioides sp. QY071]
MVTLSIIKADTGGWVGHSAVHGEQMEEARRRVVRARETGLLIDGYVGACGDDLALIMTHDCGVEDQRIHGFAWEVFEATTQVANRLGLYGAGQDLLKDAFSGNLRGMGPGYAELEMDERRSEPVLCFLADKTEPGAWNLPLYKMFADPFNTAGLVIDATMHAGFVFEVYDLYAEKYLEFSCPDEIYDLLMYIGAPARYVVHSVRSRATGAVAAATSTQRLSLIAGKYVGKDDPVMIVRCQSGFPAVGEAVEPFAQAFSVAGCMRGSHHAPLMPVGVEDAHPTRFDGPPRVVALGFQLHAGQLGLPRDLFADPSFDRARSTANEVMDYLRRHGPFEPHRLPLSELEYTTMHDSEARLAERWQPIPAPPEPRETVSASHTEGPGAERQG